MTDKTRRQMILDTAEDLVSKFLYYDRKEDEGGLVVGEIDEAVGEGEITVDEIVATFREHLEASLS